MTGQLLVRQIGNSSQLSPVNGGPLCIEAADFDRDGFVDLVIGTAYGEKRIYRGDQRGGFHELGDRLPCLPNGRGGVIAGIAVGDVDADGDLDIVFGSGGPDQLFLNDGAGRFVEAPTQLPASRSGTTVSVVLVDVEGDGDLDIVTGEVGQDRLYVNDGRGVFRDVTAARMPAVTEWARAVRAADVDADGDPDLIVANNPFGPNGGTPSTLHRIYLNDGRGSFAMAPAGLPAVNEFTSSLAVGDVDGDGDPDIVLANSE